MVLSFTLNFKYFSFLSCKLTLNFTAENSLNAAIKFKTRRLFIKINQNNRAFWKDVEW